MYEALDLEYPEEQFLALKEKAGYPGAYIEELFLFGKVCRDQAIKDEIRSIIEAAAPPDVFKAFKNRKKFPEIKGYNWQLYIDMLLKYAKLSPSLDIGKMHLLLGQQSIRFYSDSKSVIPVEAGRFTYAQTLSIYSDAEQAWPEELGQLKNVEKIYIQGSIIPKLPTSFKDLPKLKELNFNVKGCASFPIEIFEYQQLESLKLEGGNSYGRTSLVIPASLNRLKNLKQLSILYWDIKHFPADIFNMPHLQDLQILQLHQLEDLPDSIRHLQSLKNFTLFTKSENFKHISGVLGACKKLESLRISGLPKLETIDPVVFTSPQLKSVNLQHLQGSFAPIKINNWSSPIENIAIDDSSTFRLVFDNPGLFSNLTTISIGKIQDDFSLPEKQNDFPYLTQLTIKCKLSSLENINTYTSLESLKIVLIPEEKIAAFPKLNNLNKLKSLSINTSASAVFSTSNLPSQHFNSLKLGFAEICFNRKEPLLVEELTLTASKFTIETDFAVKGLNSLRIYGTALTELPDIFKACDRLIKIRINGNFETLPDSIGQLQTLKHFIFQGNLKRLPDTIGDLANLEYFSIKTGVPNPSKKEMCVLEYIPDSFSNLKSLKHLEIERYTGKNYEAVFSGLPQLERLKLSSLKNFERIPSSFVQLKKLEELFITECENFTAIGHYLAALPNLKILRLRLIHCDPKDFINITKIKQLEHFDVLGWNKLTYIPEEISNLKKLDTLLLTSLNNVSVIPDCIGDMKNLVVLGLGGPNIKTLPKTLIHLSKLKVLHISSRVLDAIPEELSVLQLEYLIYSLSKFGGNNMKKEIYAKLLKPFTKHIENIFHKDLYGTYIRPIMGEK